VETFKVIGLLVGMQCGHTKLWRLLCEWDKHCKITDGPIWENSVPGEKCIRNQPLVDKEKILLPPLHIKFGFMKNFGKDVIKHGEGFEYMRKKIPKISDA